MTPEDRAAIRQRAINRARALGFRRTDPAEAPATVDGVTLPTLNHNVLRQLLHRGHLTAEQGQLARQMFAEAATINDQEQP